MSEDNRPMGIFDDYEGCDSGIDTSSQNEEDLYYDDCDYDDELSPAECIQQMVNDAQHQTTNVIAQINQVCETIGYRRTQYQHGSSLELFLQDNPGAIERLYEFMQENAECWIEEA